MFVTTGLSNCTLILKFVITKYNLLVATTVLWPPVVIGPDISRMVPSYHLTFTSQKGTPLLVHPMLATRVHRSGYLQDGAIVPSDLLISQKGTSLLVHPMLHPAIFGGLQCCYPYKIPSSVAKQ